MPLGYKKKVQSKGQKISEDFLSSNIQKKTGLTIFYSKKWSNQKNKCTLCQIVPHQYKYLCAFYSTAFGGLEITSESKKPRQIAVVIYCCDMSRFFDSDVNNKKTFVFLE